MNSEYSNSEPIKLSKSLYTILCHKIIPNMLSSSPRICQSIGCFFVKRPKNLSATSSLSVEQSLVHLDRVMHFSQKVVGVTLKQALFIN